MNRPLCLPLHAAGLAGVLALAACGGNAPPAEPVPAPTAVAAIDTPPPQYPVELACAGIGGQVLLGVEVGPAGTPTRIDLVRGSGNDELDRLARESVQGWKFRPATRGGQPVVVQQGALLAIIAALNRGTGHAQRPVAEFFPGSHAGCRDALDRR